MTIGCKWQAILGGNCASVIRLVLAFMVGCCVTTDEVEAQDDSGRWVTRGQDEYRVVFTDRERGRGWILSCGSYAGPPAFGAGVFYLVDGFRDELFAEGVTLDTRDAITRRRDKLLAEGANPSQRPLERDFDVGDWHAVAIQNNDPQVTGAWVYAMLHGSQLPEPFDGEGIWRAPLENFAEEWRKAEGDEVCTHRTQAYRKLLAIKNGYPSDAIGDGWGLGDEPETLIFRDRIYNGGSYVPDYIDMRMSCRDGISIVAALLRRDGEEFQTMDYVYAAAGWGSGDEQVVFAMFTGEPLPDGAPPGKLSERGWRAEQRGDVHFVGVPPVEELDAEGLSKLWPYFAAKCPEAKAAYEEHARAYSNRRDLPGLRRIAPGDHK